MLEIGFLASLLFFLSQDSLYNLLHVTLIGPCCLQPLFAALGEQNRFLVTTGFLSNGEEGMYFKIFLIKTGFSLPNMCVSESKS